jgi:fibronectin type 3 domain-containing protein
LNGAPIAPAQSATLDVTFAPKNTEQMSGNVTVTSNATNSPSLIALSGMGVAAVHSVALSWGASTSSGVAGYYVYCATAPSAAYAKLLTSPVSGLNYTDGSVASGATYLYVVTAVDARGVESAYSGFASAMIP